MDIESLLVISFLCAIGAISPGPSLAVVLRNTIYGGRVRGVMTGLGHGLAFSIYAIITVMGFSSLLLANKQLFYTIQWAGALVLLWLAFSMMITNKQSVSAEKHDLNGHWGFLEGFMIVFFNPKILVFLVAVFSQFLKPDITNPGLLIMAMIAGIIDTIWYVFVAAVLSRTTFLDELRANATIIDRSIGIVLLVLAILLIIKTLVLDVS